MMSEPWVAGQRIEALFDDVDGDPFRAIEEAASMLRDDRSALAVVLWSYGAVRYLFEPQLLDRADGLLSAIPPGDDLRGQALLVRAQIAEERAASGVQINFDLPHAWLLEAATRLPDWPSVYFDLAAIERRSGEWEAATAFEEHAKQLLLAGRERREPLPLAVLLAGFDTSTADADAGSSL